jgi:hypothetical protein
MGWHYRIRMIGSVIAAGSVRAAEEQEARKEYI